jgi:hypothetical protein
MLAMLERTRLLIIDDWGAEPLTAEQRRGRSSTTATRRDRCW